jgi:hypothetical protein
MTVWTVHVEARAPEGAEAIADPETRREALAAALADRRGRITVAPRSWSATFTVETDEAHADVREAAYSGHALVVDAADASALPRWPFARIDAQRADVVDEEAVAPPFPEVVGEAEVVKILGISKAYFGQLRSAGRFPEPVAQLRATPIWTRAAVEEFRSTRRSTSRPKPVVPSGLTVRRIGSQRDLVAKLDGPQLAPIPPGTGFKAPFKLRPAIKE